MQDTGGKEEHQSTRHQDTRRKMQDAGGMKRINSVRELEEKDA